MQNRFELATARLILIGADEALLRAELNGKDALAGAIDAVVPPAWPPEHHDRGVIEWVLRSLGALAPQDPWRFFYMVLQNPRTVIGTCGFKGSPDERGCAEVGYSVLDEFQRRGFASEAVMALMTIAFETGASEVAAETFPSLLPSLRVMEKCGMTEVGEGTESGTVRYSKRL